MEEVCSSRRKLRCWWSSRQIRLLDLLACGGDEDDDEDDNDVDDDEDEDDRDGDEDEEGDGNVKDHAYIETYQRF